MMKAYTPDIFVVSPNFFHTVFTYSQLPQGNETGDDTGNDTNIDTTQLTDRQRVIVALIKENDTIKIAQMVPLLKVSLITVKRELAYLQKIGIIKREGNNVSGYWEIIEP